MYIVTNKPKFKAWVNTLPQLVQDNIWYACNLCVHDKKYTPYILVSHNTFVRAPRYLDLRFKSDWYVNTRFVKKYSPPTSLIKVIK